MIAAFVPALCVTYRYRRQQFVLHGNGRRVSQPNRHDMNRKLRRQLCLATRPQCIKRLRPRLNDPTRSQTRVSKVSIRVDRRDSSSLNIGEVRS